MRKKFDKKDWRTWGVGDLIPESVLERMVALPDFDINYVRKAAESHLKRFVWCRETAEMYRQILELNLGYLSSDPVRDNVFTLGGFLEYAFIVKTLEDWLRKRGEDEDGNISRRKLRTQIRADLRVGK